MYTVCRTLYPAARLFFLYMQLSVGLGLSSPSFSMYITTHNSTFRHSGCLDLPLCEPISTSTSGANVQRMYCDLELVYTPCIEFSSAGILNRIDCQVGLLSYISIVNLGTILQRMWYCDCKHIISPLCSCVCSSLLQLPAVIKGVKSGECMQWMWRMLL